MQDEIFLIFMNFFSIFEKFSINISVIGKIFTKSFEIQSSLIEFYCVSAKKVQVYDFIGKIKT